MPQPDSKLGLNGAWAMAVGGMVGGGIFSTLGVTISIAGRWAWLSFVCAGVVALLAGYAYAKLAKHYGKGGGAFTFLREENAKGFAGSLAWVLVVAYVLTNAVYAYTFGAYLAHVCGLGPWFTRTAAVAILAAFVGVNLRGVGEAGRLEIFLVWFKLSVLVALAAFGLARWDPSMLSRGVEDAGPGVALFGAASVFMAYEGFQLLAYDYEDIRDPDKTLPRSILLAILAVIGVYVAVALGTAMLVSAGSIVDHEEVALAIAGREALGTAGVVMVTIAAAFSTGSAINSTLFATGRLSRQIARDGEFPAFFSRLNKRGAPDRSVITLGILAATLAALGTLSALVESASLAFLFTFCVVCALAFRVRAGSRWLTGAGALLAGAATLALVVRLARNDFWAIVFLFVVGVVAVFVRPVILAHTRTSDGSDA